METLLILDTETSSLSPQDGGKIVEIAVALYDIEHRTIRAAYSEVLHAPDNPAEKVNRIPSSLVAKLNPAQRKHAFGMVNAMAEEADAVLAHNAKFDHDWMQKDEMADLVPALFRSPWVCTMRQLSFLKPASGSYSKLTYLACDHDIPTVGAHRAFSDVHMLCQLLALLEPDDLRKQIANAFEPRVVVWAVVSYAEKDAAKEAGFQWVQSEKAWLKSVMEKEAAAFMSACSFPTRLWKSDRKPAELF